MNLNKSTPCRTRLADRAFVYSSRADLSLALSQHAIEAIHKNPFETMFEDKKDTKTTLLHAFVFFVLSTLDHFRIQKHLFPIFVFMRKGSTAKHSTPRSLSRFGLGLLAMLFLMASPLRRSPHDIPSLQFNASYHSLQMGQLHPLSD